MLLHPIAGTLVVTLNRPTEGEHVHPEIGGEMDAGGLNPADFAGPARPIISAIQKTQQLDVFKDHALIDALQEVTQRASQAAMAIVNEASAIFTKAECCRLVNDDEAHAVLVRITAYFSEHPRLRILESALDQLRVLLNELDRRANKARLELPKTKRARQDTVKEFLESVQAMQRFADDLYPEFRFLKRKTGLAREQIESIEEVMKMGPKSRLSHSGQVLAAVREGREVVEQSLLRGAPDRLDTTMALARTVFL
jgi:hypothetical protein